VQKFNPPNVPELFEIESRVGVRQAVKRLQAWVAGFQQRIEEFLGRVSTELTPLYGEADYTPGAIASGAQATTTVTVTNSIFGYAVQELSYDKDLEGLTATAYVSAADTITIVLFNGTVGSVTLTAGRFRVSVKPRVLSS